MIYHGPGPSPHRIPVAMTCRALDFSTDRQVPRVRTCLEFCPNPMRIDERQRGWSQLRVWLFGELVAG